MTSNVGIDRSPQLLGFARGQHSYSDFPIGVICALAVEKAAFVAMLDEEYDPLPTPKDDGNSYTFGRIGDHNIVAACLPAGLTGISSAAIVAKDMLRSFSIKIGLMVGVGGGIWSKAVDIRLGDVVVSQPDGIHGGVVQWDFGKMESGGFKRTGSLNKPPRLLLNAVQDIQMKHMTEGDSLAKHLSRMVQNKPRMAPTFSYQGTENDNLYESSYHHVGGEMCTGCDRRKIVERPHRTTTDPYIHYGNIASGNEVIKDSHFRDHVARQEGVICFEMEAAGLMDNFPCLVIRGICDYADSHKNKRWQPYAAATAAAYAKELLGMVKKQGVEDLETAGFSRYLVPFSLEGIPQVRKFVDRPEEIASLERALLPKQGQTQRQKIRVLCGLGGIGKTQLAVEFMRRTNRQFSAVFWLDGRSEDSLKRSITSCASRIPRGQISEMSRTYADGGASEEVDINMVVREFMGWLARPDNTAWLLIIDNVDREDSGQDSDSNAYSITRYFSGADHGSVLITTRLARLEQLGESQQLGRVNNAQAEAILESWYQKKHDTNESGRLFELLDGLPLAIAQAGAYLRESGIGLKAYLKFYEHQWNELMELKDIADAPLRDYPHRSIWTTWAISYQAVRSKHEATANLLLLWSFLDNRDLWHGLFAAACQASKAVMQLLSECIGEIAKSELAFSQAMALLRNYSLIEGAEEVGSYTMHPVVYRWAYHYQGQQFASSLAPLCILAVGWAVPDPSIKNCSAVQRRLIPHAQAASRWVLQNQTNQCRGNRNNDEDGNDNNAQVEVLGATHLLGVLYMSQGKLAEADEMFMWALRRKEEVLGYNHSSTLETIRHIGNLYQNQGKLEEAEKMLQCALQGFENVFGCKHTSTLHTINDLGILYHNQGKLEEAEKMFDRALSRREEVLGPTHMSTVQTVGNLCGLYLRQGRLSEAEQKNKRALEEFEQVLGCNHTWTLHIINNLGCLYLRQGKLGEAEKLFKRALEGKEAVLPHDHMSILTTVENLGNIYADQGKLKSAEEMYQRVLKGRVTVLGLEHTSTLDVLNNLGILYGDQGNVQMAEKMYRRALKGRETVYGPNHPWTLETVNNLGNLCNTQNKLDEAENLLQRALKGREKALGLGHTLTLDAANNLGLVYKRRGMPDKAHEMLQRALEGTEKALGPDHLSTLNIMNNIGMLYIEQGKTRKAEKTLQPVLQGYEKHYGTEHQWCCRLRNLLSTLKGTVVVND